MNLWRWNKGIGARLVVQQSLPKGAPDWVARCEVPRRKGGDIDARDDQRRRHAALARAAELHHAARLERPLRPARQAATGSSSTSTRASEDFDRSARRRSAMADMLRELGLTPFAKVTGSRGHPRRRAAEAHARRRTRCASGRASWPSGSPASARTR